MALSREQFKKIKKYTKEEMEAYLKEVYTDGHNSGVQKGLEVTKELFIQGILKTPGIGEKRSEAIIASVNKCFEDYNSNSTKS